MSTGILMFSRGDIVINKGQKCKINSCIDEPHYGLTLMEGKYKSQYLGTYPESDIEPFISLPFKVGDRVKRKDNEEGIIMAFDVNQKEELTIFMKLDDGNIVNCGIDMIKEEAVLDFSELLRGYEGEIFYILGVGDAKFAKFSIIQGQISQVDFKTLKNKSNQVSDLSVMLDGTWINGDGTVILYPSRELYEKYPLDPYSAWIEWKESQKQKFVLEIEISSWLDREDGRVNKKYDGKKWLKFDSKEELDEAVKAIKEIIEKNG